MFSEGVIYRAWNAENAPTYMLYRAINHSLYHLLDCFMSFFGLFR